MSISTDAKSSPGGGVSARVDHTNNFDLIRLLAASQVLLVHIPNTLSLTIKPAVFAFLLGQFPGVSVFFVVSGFLVTQSYRYGSGGAVSYFGRRALRIYPALWVNIGLIVLLLAATGSLSSEIRGPKLLEWLLVTFFMGSEIAGNFFVGIITAADGLYRQFPSGVTWTLVVEIGFYILLPFIILGRSSDKRRLLASLVVWMIISLLVSHYYFHLKDVSPEGGLTKLLSINTFTYLWTFLIGVTCAIYWDRLHVFFEGYFLPWLAVYLCAAVFVHFYFHVDDFGHYTSTAGMEFMTLLMAGVVMSFAFTWRNAAAILRGNDLSYGIYLYHRPIIVSLGLLGFAGMWIGWPLVLGATIALAGLSWFLLEQRALRLKTHLDRWSGATLRTMRLSADA